MGDLGEKSTKVGSKNLPKFTDLFERFGLLGLKTAIMAERQYDSDRDSIPLPPGMDPSWLAKEGVRVLLNAGVKNAEELFKKFR